MTERYDDDEKDIPQGARKPGGEGERLWIARDLIRRGEVPAGAVHTWLWLRCLCQDSGPGRAFSMEELAELSGKSQATLYEHLRILKQAGALGWERAGKGRMRVVFETGEETHPGTRGAAEEERTGEEETRRHGDAERGSVGEEGIRKSGIQETGIRKSGIQNSGNAPSLKQIF